MEFEIVSIGDEVLQGRIVNTNTSFLSHALVERGWRVARQTTLPDEGDALEKGLQEALQRSSCVITTGGLGPTCDDLTRSVAARLFHSSFHFDAEIAASLRRRYGDQLASLQDQATVPTKATVLINNIGTAPGLIFEDKGKCLILLPGVPPEMRPMFLEQVLTFLNKRFPIKLKMLQSSLHLCLLNENSVDPILRKIKQAHPKMGIGIYPGYGILTLVFSCTEQEELMQAEARIREAFPTNILPATSAKIEETLHKELIKRKKTLALAESMTGGKIAEQIVAQSGASEYFLGSIVAYADSWKRQFLSVKEKTLQSKGAVSKEVVQEMLEGLLLASNADYGIAVSGVAGPLGGSEEKPVGTVWCAIGEQGKEPDVARLHWKGSRETTIMLTSNWVLASLWRKIVHGKAFVG